MVKVDDDSSKNVKQLEMTSLTAEVTAEKDNLIDDKPPVELNGLFSDLCSLCSNFFAFVKAYVSYAAQYTPTAFWFISIICLVIPSYFIIVDVFFNPIETFGVIEEDYSNINIQSDFDSAIKKISHWCLKGDNESCRCGDPTQPFPRSEYRRWSNAHAGNVMEIQDAIKQDLASPDIAFLGGSVVEKMDGRWWGDITAKGLDEISNVFETHFSGKDGSMTAVALGIAADTVSSFPRLQCEKLFVIMIVLLFSMWAEHTCCHF